MSIWESGSIRNEYISIILIILKQLLHLFNKTCRGFRRVRFSSHFFVNFWDSFFKERGLFLQTLYPVFSKLAIWYIYIPITRRRSKFISRAFWNEHLETKRKGIPYYPRRCVYCTIGACFKRHMATLFETLNEKSKSEMRILLFEAINSRRRCIYESSYNIKVDIYKSFFELLNITWRNLSPEKLHLQIHLFKYF